ncbi:MAG TPA: D-hexose-6-phosphate mutarotase [Limnobacter sp.]|nr:D-hexose-6-phosphate mutarotase [Limnobacter sp.]
MEKLEVLQHTRWGDVFYHSPIRLAGKPHRGGVPLLFPQFASAGPLRKHGFARDTAFEVVHQRVEGNCVDALYTLQVQPQDWPGWPHAAKLAWHIAANAQLLTLSFAVSNTGGDAFEWTGGLHPYFRVANLAQVCIHGLGNLPMRDKFTGDGVEPCEPLNAWRGQEFERHYLAPANIQIVDAQAGTSFALSATGFDEWMVWNPGQALANTLPDLPPGDWSRFVCVEPIACERPVRLQVGEQFTGALHVRVSGV